MSRVVRLPSLMPSQKKISMAPGPLYGMTGIKLGYGPPETWPVRPAALPTGWKALRVERVWIRGEPWTLEAQAGNSAKLAPAR